MTWMPEIDRTLLRRTLFLVAAGLQIGAGIVFVNDIIADLREPSSHTLFELAGVVGLAVGLALTLREYRSLLRRNTKVERELGAATGAFATMIHAHFDQWGLTAAERDVAVLSVKGVSIAEIAAMRNTAPGTIKAQSAAIYRKAGVSSRAEMISLLIEDLIAGVPLP